eukprot:COSAG02_NODE_6087_length_3812_cov_3.269324_2_plen_58_part_00
MAPTKNGEMVWLVVEGDATLEAQRQGCMARLNALRRGFEAQRAKLKAEWIGPSIPTC